MRRLRRWRAGPVGDGSWYGAFDAVDRRVYLPGPAVSGPAPAQPDRGLCTVYGGLLPHHVAGYVGQEALSSLAVLALEYIPAGIALAWAYEKADTIFAPILMHAVINAVSIQALL